MIMRIIDEFIHATCAAMVFARDCCVLKIIKHMITFPFSSHDDLLDVQDCEAMKLLCVASHNFLFCFVLFP